VVRAFVLRVLSRRPRRSTHAASFAAANARPGERAHARGRRVGVALLDLAHLGRPRVPDPVEHLDADRQPAGGQDARLRTAGVEQRRIPRRPAVAPLHPTTDGPLDRPQHVEPRAERQQVDVLAEPAVGDVGAGQRGPPEEGEVFRRDLRRERTEHVADQVVPTDLSGIGAELGRDPRELRSRQRHETSASARLSVATPRDVRARCSS